MASNSDSESEYMTDDEQGQPRPKKKRYAQTYKKDWEKQVTWVTHSPKGDEYAFCTICDKDLSCSEGGLKDLKRHGEREKHKRLSKGKHGQITLSTAWNKSEDMATKAARAEAILCNMLVEHNLPFMLMDHLPGLISHAFPDSKIAKEVKCARTKTTAVIKHALAPAAHKNLISKVSTSPAFSLLMDESTDRGDLKREGTLIRYYDEATLHVTTGFLGLQEVPQATASNLFECLDFHLKQDGLTYEKLIGWNSDGASVMLGKRNSVVSRLKAKQPNLYVLHCICHVSHLMIHDVVGCIPSYIINLTENLFWWFHHSAKRVTELKSFQDWLEVEAHKILKKVDTRWLSLEACINRIIEQYDPLKSYFDSIESSKLDEKARKKMKTMRDHLKSPITKAYLLFLSNILSIINKFNLLFQSSSPNAHRLLKEMNQLILSILNKFIIPSAIHSAAGNISAVSMHRSNQKEDDDLILGTPLRKYLREMEDELLGTQELSNFFLHIRDFLAKLVQSAVKRLPLHDEVLQDMVWLDPAERISSTSGMVRRLGIRFDNFISEDMLDQLIEEFCLYQTTGDLPTDVLSTQEIDQYWGKIGRLESSTGKTYGVLSFFAKCLLSIPHGNADSERMFSQINLIKTQHRCQLDTSTVAACLDTKLNLPISDCRKYEPQREVVKATRKVTPKSELAPKHPTPAPSLSSTSQLESHKHNTRSKTM